MAELHMRTNDMPICFEAQWERLRYERRAEAPRESEVEADFERERWLAELRLREHELKIRDGEVRIKRREVAAKIVELRRARWTNPIVLALMAAGLAAAASVCVALFNGSAQRAQDERHAIAERQLEEGKEDAARILEAVRNYDPEKAAANLSVYPGTA